ncbi:MFS transporter [Lusitaniella coriacea]|uniref:MFS transporter n=1 Tax=Lusitaniella coriacea TaxID=1983105 RepID=UPI003CEC3157
MTRAPSFKKYGLLGSLYLSQFMPFWFIFQALPVLLRQNGASLEAIGFLPALLIPISFKFLWSPFIDTYGFTRWGHYRFWIICFQSVVAILTVFCSFLNIEIHLPLVLIGLTLIALGSSSQDIAADALALGLLEPEERGVGNAVQGIGGAFGRAIGGGGMLILLGRWGWRTSLLSLAGMMLFALIPLLMHREKIPSCPRPLRLNPQQIAGGLRAYLKIFLEICQRPGMKTWLGILALATAGYNLSATMFRPFLVDIGWLEKDIGWLMGIFGMAMTVLGSLVTGLVISRLGRARSFLIALMLTILGILLQLLPTFGLTQVAVLYTVVGLSFFAVGMTGTTAFTIMMDKSHPEMAGTDYTFQTSVIPLFSIVSAALSGFVARFFGYQGVFLLGTILVAIAAILTLKFPHRLSPGRQGGDLRIE